MKKAIVLGAGGFIGSHLVSRLKSEGYVVKGVDLKYPEYAETEADEFLLGDLRDANVVADSISEGADEVYQLAADMGGAGYLSGDLCSSSGLSGKIPDSVCSPRSRITERFLLPQMRHLVMQCVISPIDR